MVRQEPHPPKQGMDWAKSRKTCLEGWPHPSSITYTAESMEVLGLGRESLLKLATLSRDHESDRVTLTNPKPTDKRQ